MANRGFYTDIEVEGVEQVIKKIGLFEIEKRQKIKTQVRLTSKKIASTAKKEVNRHSKSKDTKKSIKTKILNDGLSATVKPRLPQGYKAHWIEYGTVDRKNKGRTGKYKGRKTGKVKADPFMKPAEMAHKKEFEDRIKKVCDKDVTV